MHLERGEIEPFRRLLERSRRRSWSREEREEMGPRRLREGREREKTLPSEEQLTPTHLTEEQASEDDQLERRLPCGSASRRN